MPDKIATHPNKPYTIKFNEKYHTYTDNFLDRYVSATTFIKPFFPKFDAIAVSKKCAAGTNPKYAGRDPKEIRKEWMAEGRRGSYEGDNTHLYAEGIMTGIPVSELPEPISDRCKLLFKQVDRITRWLLTRYDFVEAEKIIFSPDLKIAGQVDAEKSGQHPRLPGGNGRRGKGNRQDDFPSRAQPVDRGVLGAILKGASPETAFTPPSPFLQSFPSLK